MTMNYCCICGREYEKPKFIGIQNQINIISKQVEEQIALILK